jgi:hypothetical protein
VDKDILTKYSFIPSGILVNFSKNNSSIHFFLQNECKFLSFLASN